MAMPGPRPAGERALERAEPQVVVRAALHDRPQRLRRAPLVVQLGVPRAAPLQPAKRPVQSLQGQLVRRLSRDHVVEGHGDVGAEVALDLDGALGRQRARGPIDVTLEGDAVLGDPPKRLERKHLEPAGVGQHRPVPGGESVQAAHVAHHRLARAEVEMVGVAEDDLRAGAAHVLGAQAADDAVRAHGHEGRRAHRPVGEREHAGPRGARLSLDRELEHQRAGALTRPRWRARDRSAGGAPGRVRPSASSGGRGSPAPARCASPPARSRRGRARAG